jgi:hypothetical protein
MPMTEQILRQLLSREEPDYLSLARQLDASDTVHLDAIARGKDAMLASKAIYAASQSLDPAAHDLVARASQSSEVLQRIAAASALPNLPELRRNQIAEHLIDEDDDAIRKLVIRSLHQLTPLLNQKLQAISTTSASTQLRQLSRDALSRTP